MNPKLRIAAVALAASSLCPVVFAQATPPRGPLDRTEILGRLALGYPPSYIAQLVAQRGLRFSLTSDFVYRVKLAGGDGILVEKLSAADASTSAAAVTDDGASVDHLAKCAELLFTGDDDSAVAECKSSISESPKSPWPLLVSANTLHLDFPRSLVGPDQQKKIELQQLLERAAALDPTLPAVRFVGSGAYESRAGESSESINELAVDAEQYEVGQQVFWEQYTGVGMFAQELSEEPESATPRIDRDEAIDEEFLHAVQKAPDLSFNHANLADQYQMRGDFEKAAKEWHEVLRLEPDNPVAHMHLGKMLLAQHKSEAALAEFRDAARIAPFGVWESLRLAATLERLGRPGDALAELQSTVALRPASVELSESLVELDVKHNDRKGAIAELRRSLEISVATAASEADAVQARSWDENDLANLLREDRQFDAAGEQYLYLIRFRPDDSGLHNDYGNVLLEQRNCDAAIAEYYQAERLAPDVATPHNNIGICRMQQKDTDGAIAEFRKTLELNPDEPRTRVFLGGALGQKGDIQAAKEQFQRVIEKDPKDAETRLNIGYAMMMFKDEADAIPQLKAGLELEPDSPAAENNLAWIYCTAEDHKLRNPSEALVLARRAVAATAASPNPAFLDTLAEAQSLNGQSREAVATETQALALDPDNPEYKSRLEQFRSAATAVASAK